MKGVVAAALLGAALITMIDTAMAASFADGQRAYDAGQFEDARLSWTPLAEAGSPEAQAGLGLLYDLGQGGPKDSTMAYAWYRRAAEAGLARAQFNVAVMLDSGIGVERDLAQAATWYARAAARGHGRAQYNLAQLYASGNGLPRNIAQAESWYHAAADGGLTAAEEKLKELSAARPAAPLAVIDRPVPVMPVEPAEGRTIIVHGEPRMVELVWIAPPQPIEVQFFVQVLAAGAEGWRELFSGYSARSAALVPLDAIATRYAWRAYVIAAGGSHYAASEWSRFAVQ